MRAIDVALKLVTVEEIEEEIQQRLDLIGVMVGDLYPRMLREEVEMLRTRKNYLLREGPWPKSEG